MKWQVAQRTWAKAVKDPHFFLWGNGKVPGLVWTMNEHAKEGENAKQRFPDRAYLRLLTDLWLDNRLLLIFKSRQMMVTWLFASLYIWKAMTPGRRMLHVCKKEMGADANLQRMWQVYLWLPDALKPKATRKSGFITVHHADGDSIIQAASQTSDDPRQFTFSDVWIDEMAFTPNAQEVHAAATPTIQGGGRFLGTSTPNGREYMFNLASDGGRIPFHDISRPFRKPEEASDKAEDSGELVEVSA